MSELEHIKPIINRVMEQLKGGNEMKTVIIKDTRRLKEQMREEMGIKINDKERPQGCEFGDILEAEFGKDKLKQPDYPNTTDLKKPIVSIS